MECVGGSARNDVMPPALLLPAVKPPNETSSSSCAELLASRLEGCLLQQNERRSAHYTSIINNLRTPNADKMLPEHLI